MPLESLSTNESVLRSVKNHADVAMSEALGSVDLDWLINEITAVRPDEYEGAACERTLRQKRYDEVGAESHVQFDLMQDSARITYDVYMPVGLAGDSICHIGVDIPLSEVSPRGLTDYGYGMLAEGCHEQVNLMAQKIEQRREELYEKSREYRSAEQAKIIEAKRREEEALWIANEVALSDPMVGVF